jgi:hypothetical protein
MSNNGSIKYEIKLKKSKVFIPDDINITGEEYLNIFKTVYPNPTGEWSKIYNYSTQVWKYELVNPVDILYHKETSKHKNVYYKTITSANSIKKKHPLTTWFDKKIQSSVLAYEPISLNYVKYWEIIHNFDLTSKHKATNNLEICAYPGFLEALTMYKSRIGNNDLIHLKYQTVDKSTTNASLDFFDIYKTIIPKLKITTMDKPVNAKIIKDLQLNTDKPKYDLISIFNRLSNDGISFLFYEQLNTQAIFATTLLALASLKNKGNLILMVDQIKTQMTADLIIYLHKVFTEVNLYRPESINNFKHTEVYVICKNFNSLIYTESDMNKLLEVLDSLNELDPTGGHNFNVTDPDIRSGKYLINRIYLKKEAEEVYALPNIVPTNNRPLTKDSITEFPISFLTSFSKNTDKIYQKLRNFNNKFFHDLIVFRQVLEQYINNLQENPLIEEDQKKFQLYYSIQWAKAHDLELKPALSGKLFLDDFGRSLMQDYYVISNTIKFQFKRYPGAFIPTIKAESIEEFPFQGLLENGDLYEKTYLTMETRDGDKYKEVLDRTNFYNPSLKRYIGEKYGMKKVSQAWLKMYEIWHVFKFIKSSGQKNVKTFHMCELPGGFIMATNHYLKSHTDVTNYEWNAQSLNPNPNSSTNSDIKGFGDDYGLVKKYKKNWLFGVDNSGDIRKVANIQLYKEYCKDIDLLTSDCGTSWTENAARDSVYLAQIVFILNNVPVGKDFVCKMFLPFSDPLKLSTIYLLYLAYEHLHIYKPYQNLQSPEYYIIGKHHKPLSKEIISKLLDILDNYKKHDLSTMALFDISKIPESFILQLERVASELVVSFKRSRDRTLYYVDNYDNITIKHWKDLADHIHEKNLEWLHKFQFKPLEQSKWL